MDETGRHLKLKVCRGSFVAIDEAPWQGQVLLFSAMVATLKKQPWCSRHCENLQRDGKASFHRPSTSSNFFPKHLFLALFPRVQLARET